MILSIHALENQIMFLSDYVNVLEIESKILYINIVRSIFNTMEGINPIEPIYLFDSKGEELTLTKNVIVLYEPLNIEINNRKFLAKLYQDIADRIKDDTELKDAFENMICDINLKVVDVLNDYNFECVYNHRPDIVDYLKMLNLKIHEHLEESLTTRLLTFIELISTFRIATLLVLVNFKAYYTEEELVEIYKHAKYQQIHVLLIEPVRMPNLLLYEYKLTVDWECDEFIEKYSVDIS